MTNRTSPSQKKNGVAKKRGAPKILSECNPEGFGHGLKWELKGYYVRKRRTKAEMKLAACTGAKSSRLRHVRSLKQRPTKRPESPLPPRAFTADVHASNMAQVILAMDSTFHIDNDSFRAHMTPAEPALFLVPEYTSDTPPLDSITSSAEIQGRQYTSGASSQFVPHGWVAGPPGYQEGRNVNHEYYTQYTQQSAGYPATDELRPETLLSGGYIPPFAGTTSDSEPSFRFILGSKPPATDIQFLDQRLFNASLATGPASPPGLNPTDYFFLEYLPDDFIFYESPFMTSQHV